MWRRKLWEAKASIPENFPLKSFYDFPTIGLDRVCYEHTTIESIKIAEQSIAKDEVLHVHPEWLFQRGKLNHRGPYYETLKTILRVDKELETLAPQKRGFFRIAKYPEQYEYIQNFIPSERFFEKLVERQVDIFTFVERKWCNPILKPSNKWFKAEDNIALLKITPYSEWLNAVGKKTRNMIRKAEKSKVRTEIVKPSENLAEGIWKIYNESPIRQGRAFSHYGDSLENVRRLVFLSSNSTFIGAFLEEELVGFIQLVRGDNIAVMSQILSLQKLWDKALNNALVAKAVEICATNNIPWLMYGRIGNHPSLDSFKENNGFSKYNLTRYYVPLTQRGRIATKLRLHSEVKDALPQSFKRLLIPIFNWESRVMIRIRSKRH
jgi:hypothetical protein